MEIRTIRDLRAVYEELLRFWVPEGYRGRRGGSLHRLGVWERVGSQEVAQALQAFTLNGDRLIHTGKQAPTRLRRDACR